MTLRSIFAELYASAEARATAEQPGEALRVLKQGAEITVRAQGRQRQVILSRHRVYVSESEIVTFRRDGEIPEHAEETRYTGKGRCYVTLTWEAPPTLWELPGDNG